MIYIVKSGQCVGRSYTISSSRDMIARLGASIIGTTRIGRLVFISIY